MRIVSFIWWLNSPVVSALHWGVISACEKGKQWQLALQHCCILRAFTSHSTSFRITRKLCLIAINEYASLQSIIIINPEGESDNRRLELTCLIWLQVLETLDFWMACVLCDEMEPLCCVFQALALQLFGAANSSRWDHFQFCVGRMFAGHFAFEK